MTHLHIQSTSIHLSTFLYRPMRMRGFLFLFASKPRFLGIILDTYHGGIAATASSARSHSPASPSRGRLGNLIYALPSKGALSGSRYKMYCIYSSTYRFGIGSRVSAVRIHCAPQSLSRRIPK